MSKPTAPFLVVLLLGLAAVWYFVFQSPTATPLDEATPSTFASADGEANILAPADAQAEPAVALIREDAASVSSSSATPVAEFATKVRVLDPDGFGIPSARILPWLGEQLQEEVLTNDVGEATLLGLQGDGGVAVMAPGYLAVHAAHNFDGTAIVVRLADGGEFAGRVVFKHPPTYSKPFVMRVFSWPKPKVEGIPKAVKDELWWHKASVASVVVGLDENGNFHITGLPPDWSGRLRMPAGYLSCSVNSPGQLRGYDFIDIPQLTSDLVINVTEIPAFTGRVVSPDGSTGVAGVSVGLVSYLTEERDHGTMVMGVSAEDGTFHLSLAGPRSDEIESWCENPQSIIPYQVNISFAGSEDWADASFSLDLAGKDPPWNLGDLPLKDRMLLSFRAVDKQGNPIAGALAYSFELSEPADADGVGKVSLSKDTLEITVGAPGFESVTKKVPASLTDVVQFALPQAVRLHVSWVTPEGADMSTATFRIYSEGHVFAVSKGAFDPAEGSFLRASGLRIQGGRGPGPSGKTSLHWRLKADQSEFFIWGLKPGVPMVAMIAGLSGASLASSEPLVFQAGEERDLELSLPFAPFDFVGHVRDENGAAIGSVEVMVRNESGGGWGASTSTDGEFRYQGMAAGMVRLTLKKYGFARLNIKNIELRPSGVPMEITMQRAREVTVFLRDASGVTYPDGYLSSPGENKDGASEEDGGFRLSALPPSEFLLSWQIGGAHGEEWIPAGVEEFVVAVPAMASVLVHARRSLVEESESVTVTFVALDSARLEDELPDYERSFRMKAGQSTIDQEFPVLLPGEYQVQYSTWLKVGDKWGDVPLGEQGPFTVAAGEVLELNFDF